MRTREICLAVVLLAAAACGPPVDLKKNLQIIDVSTGWADAGLTEDGQNKLVPFVQFKLKNNSDQSLPVLQVNTNFRPLKEDKEWGDKFQQVTGSEGLAPGATSAVLTLRSNRGAKGTDPRAAILKSSYFVDARVQISAKYGSVPWVKMDEYPVTRRLVTN
jgi:hypothetical protein